MVLFLSTTVGEAIFSAGALIAQQVTRGHKVALVTVLPSVRLEESKDVLATDLAVGAFLGLQVEHWTVESGKSKNSAGLAKFSADLQELLSAFIEENQVHTIVVSKNLGNDSYQQAAIGAVQQIRKKGATVRCFCWYNQPFVARNKGAYPELAFVQRVNGLAEIGDQVCNFVWQPANKGPENSPLSLKLQAAALYTPILESTFYTPFELSYNQEEDVKQHLSMTLGRKEWFEQLATD